MPSAPTVNVPHTATGRHVVLFDGVCDLCNGFVQFIIRHDKHERFMFGPLQSPEGQALLKDTPVDPGKLDTVVYVRHDRILSRSTAALYIMRDLGGAWPLMAVFLLVPPPLRDMVYRIIANNRYRWFGKRDSCMIPTPALRARFINGPGYY